MITQRVNLGRDSYDIHFGDLSGFGAPIAEVCQPKGAVIVVADRTAWDFHGGALTSALRGAGLPGGFGLSFESLILPPGEHNKSIEGLLHIYQFFARAGLRRDGLVIAFGGGVIGDLAGFAAATWMRGVPLVQVPTTLLAQVDSSVGGKTAVNLPEGKNLAGVFYQPRLALIDANLLDTLTPRDFRCGLAEVIKYGAIFSKDLFDKLSAPTARGDLPAIVAECCRLKGGVVERDEKEAGERMLLNFGHTFGHAVEKMGGFETYSHGEAVSIGMVLAAGIGEALGLTRTGCAGDLRRVLAARGLPWDCPYKPTDLLHDVRLDKKAGAGGIALVLLRDIGDAFVHRIGEPALRDVLERMERMELS